VREARELIRHRVTLVWERTGVTNRLLALLARRNLQPTSGQRWSTVGGQRELHALPLTPIPTTIREDCLALRRLLNEQIRRLDQALIQRWGNDARVRRLATIPGIGPFLAILVVLELADVHRFPSAKHMASAIGLTPRVRASAGRARSGPGTGWSSGGRARRSPAWPWRGDSRRSSTRCGRKRLTFWRCFVAVACGGEPELQPGPRPAVVIGQPPSLP